MRLRILLLALLLLSQEKVRPQTAAELLTSGETARRHNLSEIAKDHFTRALNLTNITPDEEAAARLGLAGISLSAKQPASARKILTPFPGKASRGFQQRKHLLEVDLFLAENDPVEALKHLDRIPPPPPPLENLYIRLKARALTDSGKPDQAIQLLQTALETNPNPELQSELADHLAERDQIESAAALWQTLAAGDPKLPATQTAVLDLARYHLSRNNIPAARNLLAPLMDHGGVSRSLEAELYPLWIETLEAENRPLEAAEYLLAWEGLLPSESDLLPVRLRRARALIHGRELQQAEILLRQLIATRGDNPQLAAVWLALAHIHRDLEQIPQALEAYETYLSVFTDPAGLLDANLNLAEIALSSGETARAKILLERAGQMTKESSPLRPLILLKQADTDFQLGELESARQRYLDFVKRYGSDHEDTPRARFQAALCLARRDTLNQALRELTQLRLAYPDHPIAERALLQHAVLLVRFLRLEQALGLFDTYLNQFPTGEFVADALTDKGLAAYRLGFFEMALLHFEDVLARFPDHPRAEQAFFMRGWSLYLLENVDEALRVGQEFLTKYPQSPFRTDVRFWLGEHAFNRGDFQQAGVTFLLIAENNADPDIRSKALYLAGRAAMGRGEFQTAVDQFTKSVETNRNAPHSVEALFHQGDALTELNRFDDAILVFDQLIQRFPNAALALAAKGRIGDCHFTLGERQDPNRLQQALAFYRLVEESSGAPPNLRFQALYKIALTLQTLGRTDEALSQYLLVIHRFQQDRSRLDPDSAAYYFNRAATSASQLYEQRQEWRNAIQIYRDIVSSGIQPAAREAEERIQNLRREHRILF